MIGRFGRSDPGFLHAIEQLTQNARQAPADAGPGRADETVALWLCVTAPLSIKLGWGVAALIGAEKLLPRPSTDRPSMKSEIEGGIYCKARNSPAHKGHAKMAARRHLRS